MTASREALIIAIGTYEDPELRRLRAPSQDAEALGRVLRSSDIGGFEVRSLVDESAPVISLAAEEFFSDRGLSDVLLVHMSCHGVKDDDGRLYFAATNTLKDRLRATAVSAAFLNDLMEHCRARSIVMLLDCCYSGAFMPGAKGDEGVHLKEKFEGEGRAILSASNAIEYSWEGNDLSGEGAPSVFTAAIVDGLETGDADRDRDGLVSIEDLYKHVYERVRAARPGQTPKMWALGIERDLFIARNPRPIEIEPAILPAELLAALESPVSEVRAGIVEVLDRLLRSTDPRKAVAARMALEQLREDDSKRVSEAASALLAPEPEAPPPVTMTAPPPPEPELSKAVGVGGDAIDSAPVKERANQHEFPPLTEETASLSRELEILRGEVKSDESVLGLYGLHRTGMGAAVLTLLALTDKGLVLVADRGLLFYAPRIYRFDYSAMSDVEVRFSPMNARTALRITHRNKGTGVVSTFIVGTQKKAIVEQVADRIRPFLK